MNGRSFTVFLIGFLFLYLNLDLMSYALEERAGVLLKEAVDLADSGSVDKAIETAREAAKADPNNPEIYDQLGYLLLRVGRPDEAISAFDSSLKINPRSRTSRTGMGLALLRKGDAKGAEAVLKEALILNPYPSMTHYALGLVYEQMNDYEKAIYHFKEGIRTYKSGKR